MTEESAIAVLQGYYQRILAFLNDREIAKNEINLCIEYSKMDYSKIQKLYDEIDDSQELACKGRNDDDFVRIIDIINNYEARKRWNSICNEVLNASENDKITKKWLYSIDIMSTNNDMVWIHKTDIYNIIDMIHFNIIQLRNTENEEDEEICMKDIPKKIRIFTHFQLFSGFAFNKCRFEIQTLFNMFKIPRFQEEPDFMEKLEAFSCFDDILCQISTEISRFVIYLARLDTKCPHDILSKYPMIIMLHLAEYSIGDMYRAFWKEISAQ